MAEVCLVGLFGREYRKLASAIPAEFEPWKCQGDIGERCESRGKWRMGVYREHLRRIGRLFLCFSGVQGTIRRRPIAYS